MKDKQVSAPKFTAGRKVQCSRCFGRGYQPEYRKNGIGFYASTCKGCGGSGEREAPRRKARAAIAKAEGGTV